MLRTTPGKKRRRSPNLTDDAVAQIVSIVGNWTGRLTWPLLVARVHRELGSTYTRQSLACHESITLAFRTRKRAWSDDPDDSSESPELRAALGKIASLEVEVARLNTAIDSYKEERVRWIYNASIRNLTETLLDQEIPIVDRKQTRRD